MLITLKAKRIKETNGLYKGFNKTEIYNEDGTLKATFPASTTQPKMGIKHITLNCFKWKLIWIK